MFPLAQTATLRFKINAIVGVLTVLFVVTVIGIEVHGMRQSVTEETEAAFRVASQLLQRTAWRYGAQGTPAMLLYLQGMGRVRSTDITLSAADGQTVYRSPPSPYKAGRDAPRWFQGLVSPHTLQWSAAVADGHLDLRSNASRAALDAWDDLVVLVQIAAGLLLALNLLVYWLVGRAVRPFARIVSALNALEGGRFDVVLPELPGAEASALGRAFNRMVEVLQARIAAERRAMQAERQLSDSRDLTRWIDHQIEEERKLIARELHDELGQSVTAMRSMALSIAQRSRERDPASEQAARVIADEASRLYDAMHGIIPRLTSLVLDNLGLAEALGDLAERTRRSHPDVVLDLDVALGHAPVEADAALALFRTAQEGITNALRHGGANRLRLTVRHDAGSVRLVLQDNGSGLAPDWAARPGHHGLRWLRERIEGSGGSMVVESDAGQGVRLAVAVPVTGGAAATPTSAVLAAAPVAAPTSAAAGLSQNQNQNQSAPA